MADCCQKDRGNKPNQIQPIFISVLTYMRDSFFDDVCSPINIGLSL